MYLNNLHKHQHTLNRIDIPNIHIYIFSKESIFYMHMKGKVEGEGESIENQSKRRK